MKKYLLFVFWLLFISNVSYAVRYKHHIIESKSIDYGIVSKETWFTLKLKNNITSSIGSQHFSANLIDPIYNKNFSKELIPANALITGTYKNDGNECSFNIDTINFSGTRITLKPGMHSIVSATLPNQPECNNNLNYNSGQILEFQNLINILNLPSLANNTTYIPLTQQDHFIKAVVNPAYDIIGVTKFTNGLMQVTVKFNKPSLKNSLLPIYYDALRLPHYLNFSVVTNLSNQDNTTYNYIFISQHDIFGFGVINKTQGFFTELWEKI
jgi:hypothetical protein